VTSATSASFESKALFPSERHISYIINNNNSCYYLLFPTQKKAKLSERHAVYLLVLKSSLSESHIYYIRNVVIIINLVVVDETFCSSFHRITKALLLLFVTKEVTHEFSFRKSATLPRTSR